MKNETLKYMSWDEFIIKIIASVGDTGKSIHGTYKGKKKMPSTHVFFYIKCKRVRSCMRHEREKTQQLLKLT